MEIMETCLEAVRSAHFADAGKMQPLTLEQLREVPHGKIKDSTLKNICHRANEIAYHPTKIDRQVWKPCESCVSCENCENNGDYNPYEGVYGECGPLTEKAWDEMEKRVRVVMA